MSTVLKKVTRIYNTSAVKVEALKNINMEIKDGEFMSIAGPSGSGKTTLLNIIGCIDEPTGGNVIIDGVDISSYNHNQLADFRNQNIGFIFQTFNLIPVLTAYENVEFALLLKGEKAHAEMKEEVENLLIKVGLKEQMKKRPNEMSGGQQQRIAVARALIKKPKIVLADEPTANLDSSTAAEILVLMQELNEEDGVTFIFSTHDRMVMEFANRLVILKDGKIKSDKKQ